MNSVKEWFKENGFNHLDTGGNCTAMVRDFEGKDSYIMITDNNHSIPTNRKDNIIIGTYINDDFIFAINTTLGQFIDNFWT